MNDSLSAAAGSSLRHCRRAVLLLGWAAVSWAAETEPPVAPGGGAAVSAVVGEVPLSAFAAVGSSIVQENRLAELGWSEAQIAAFLEGAQATFRGEPRPMDEAATRLAVEINRRLFELKEREVREAFARPAYLAQYLREMRKRFGLQESDSGLCFGLRSADGGMRPSPEDAVVLSIAASAFDATTKLDQLSGERLRFKVTELPPGLAEGVQMMCPGSQAMFVVPPALSFGDGPWPRGVSRGTPLVFMVALHEIVTAPGSAPPNGRP